jgi:VIT1/CCC1 family predicted Fe2+/Mn2+ transporter
MMSRTAAEAGRGAVLTAGVAGLVAGAMSMAAGEYVSVSSQRDTEEADLRRESRELEQSPQREHEELAGIYMERGVDPDTARRVAEQMMAHDALGAHARDELGVSHVSTARPVQAALASAGAFALGGVMPLAVAALASDGVAIPVVAGASLVFLAGLGALAARAGGASARLGATRVTLWGALAMALTTAVGRLFGTVL